MAAKTAFDLRDLSTVGNQGYPEITGSAVPQQSSPMYAGADGYPLFLHLGEAPVTGDPRNILVFAHLL